MSTYLKYKCPFFHFKLRSEPESDPIFFQLSREEFWILILAFAVRRKNRYQRGVLC